jgi:alanine dehydrogenase
LIIGVPREIKDHENRVALTPRSVSSLVTSGGKVLVETLAGAKSGFSDDEYSAAGATVVGSAAELYSGSDLIVKVKEIQVGKGEHEHIKSEHTIFGFSHFESSRQLTEMAVKSHATFISFEKVVDHGGQTPLLMPMSRIAGTVAGIWAGFFHNYAFKHDKSIRLKAGSDQVKSKFIEGFERLVNANIDPELRRMLSLRDRAVIVFGGGSVGEMAARMCAALGARMIIVEKREARTKYLQKINLPRCSITGNADRDILRRAHVIIGATYDREKTDRVVDEKMLKEISEIRKKIVIDVSIDQGGNFPYLDSSGRYSPACTGSILSPALLDYFGNTFIRVPNIPSIVPRYASSALSSIITEYVKDIAGSVERPELTRAVSIRNGRILDEAIVKAHNLK